MSGLPWLQELDIQEIFLFLGSFCFSSIRNIINGLVFTIYCFPTLHHVMEFALQWLWNFLHVFKISCMIHNIISWSTIPLTEKSSFDNTRLNFPFGFLPEKKSRGCLYATSTKASNVNPSKFNNLKFSTYVFFSISCSVLCWIYLWPNEIFFYCIGHCIPTNGTELFNHVV